MQSGAMTKINDCFIFDCSTVAAVAVHRINSLFGHVIMSHVESDFKMRHNKTIRLLIGARLKKPSAAVRPRLSSPP